MCDKKIKCLRAACRDLNCERLTADLVYWYFPDTKWRYRDKRNLFCGLELEVKVQQVTYRFLSTHVKGGWIKITKITKEEENEPLLKQSPWLLKEKPKRHWVKLMLEPVLKNSLAVSWSAWCDIILVMIIIRSWNWVTGWLVPAGFHVLMSGGSSDGNFWALMECNMFQNTSDIFTLWWWIWISATTEM